MIGSVTGFLASIVGAPMADMILNIVIILVKVVVVIGVTLLHVAYATYWERKVIAICS